MLLSARSFAAPFDRMDEALAAFLAGRCEALAADISGLHAIRAGSAQHAKGAVLAQAISKEPFSPSVRQGDDQFATSCAGRCSP